MQESTQKYDDLIELPHHVSSVHPRMAVQDRAAQFAPFSALTGHEEAVRETARLTRERVELDEEYRKLLDERLQLLRELLHTRPFISVTYFVADGRKAGGAYITVRDRVKKLKEYEQQLVMEEGVCIPIEDITALEGELFERYE